VCSKVNAKLVTTGVGVGVGVGVGAGPVEAWQHSSWVQAMPAQVPEESNSTSEASEPPAQPESSLKEDAEQTCGAWHTPLASAAAVKPVQLEHEVMQVFFDAEVEARGQRTV